MHSSIVRNITIFAAVICLSGTVAAKNFDVKKLEFGQPIKAAAVDSQSRYGFMSSAPTVDVYLMNLKLTPEQKQHLLAFQTLNQPLSTPASSGSLPASVKLGMNNVPVLNQGQHGSCVTFANTAALDALLGKGDFVSQFSFLELGSYLDDVTYLPNGWEGSFGPYVLSRLRDFGIVKKASANEYPLNEDSTGAPLSPQSYAKISENVNDDFYWYSVLTFNERFEWSNSAIPSESLRILNAVKTALANAEKNKKRDARITFGSLLPVSHCSVGACGKYHSQNDTWALTSEILKDKDLNIGGHEMVITGYDDNAVSVDNEGKRHVGLLILRNSWSDKAGDHGDFYMTYDFFRSFVMEVQILAKQ